MSLTIYVLTALGGVACREIRDGHHGPSGVLVWFGPVAVDTTSTAKLHRDRDVSKRYPLRRAVFDADGSAVFLSWRLGPDRIAMFDTIILLTSPEEQPVLAAWLRRHRPQLKIHHAVTAADVDALEPPLLTHARLVAFASHVIVPASVLGALGGGAYNFHPGPPHYPGWAPAHFAIYERAATFGATAHLMVERVDAGPIIGVETFAVPAGATVHSLECLGYAALARLYQLLAKPLATQAQPLPDLGIVWSGRKGSRRSYAELCEIPLDISKEEFDRRMHAFGGDHFGITHTINLHGRRFRLLPADEDRHAEVSKCPSGSPAPTRRADGVAEPGE